MPPACWDAKKKQMNPAWPLGRVYRTELASGKPLEKWVDLPDGDQAAEAGAACLDADGNLILRVDRYGNADSAGPESALPLGGDEIALFDAHFVATQTDRRLFISDVGNARIVSVKLGYHATAMVSLRNVPDSAGP